MAAAVTSRPEVRFGTPEPLFSEDDVGTKLSLPRHVEHFYDVAPDGERFVVVKGIQQGSSDLVLAQGVFQGR